MIKEIKKEDFNSISKTFDNVTFYQTGIIKKFT